MKNKIIVTPHRRIDTKDSGGKSNGWLLEINSDRDGFTDHIQGQTYLTVAAPGLFKGYHAHALADYFVTCIKGKIREIVYTNKDSKMVTETGDEDFKTIFVPKGCPHAIENIGAEDAYVLIYRYPSWSPDVKEQFDIAPEEIENEESWQKLKQFCENIK